MLRIVKRNLVVIYLWISTLSGIEQDGGISAQFKIYKGRTVVSFNVRIHTNKTNSKCQEGWELSLPFTVLQQEKLHQTLDEHKIAQVWLPLKRKNTTDFMWLNKIKYDDSDWLEGRGHCGRLEADTVNTNDNIISRAECNDDRYGYICQFQGPCPHGALLPSCLDDHSSNQHFSFHCEETGWFPARSRCQSRGGRLVIVDTDSKKKQISSHIRRLPVACHTAMWIGLHRVDYVPYHDEQGVHADVPLGPWADGQPDTSRNCVIINKENNEYLWKTTDCHKHSYMCWKRSIGDDVTGVSGKPKTHSEAVDYCNSLGAGWRMPSAEEIHREQWKELLQLNGLSQTWTSTKREMAGFRWMDVNNTRFKRRVTGTGNCVCLNSSGHQEGQNEQLNLQKADCADNKTGFICQYQGPCPQGYSPLQCVKSGNNRVFTYHMEASTFMGARKACYSRGGRLAVLEEEAVYRDVINRMYRLTARSTYWLGLTNQQYKDVLSNSVVDIHLDSWNADEPSYNNGDCVASELHASKITLKMFPCHQKLPVVCAKNTPAEDNVIQSTRKKHSATGLSNSNLLNGENFPTLWVLILLSVCGFTVVMTIATFLAVLSLENILKTKKPSQGNTGEKEGINHVGDTGEDNAHMETSL